MASTSTSEVTSEEPLTPTNSGLYLFRLGFLFPVAHVQYHFNVVSRGECCNYLVIINVILLYYYSRQHIEMKDL